MKAVVVYHIAGAEKQQGTRSEYRLAPRAGFLVIALDVFGGREWMTNRTFGLLMPMPNAMVTARITRTSSRRNISPGSLRAHFVISPAW